jgi:CheY-like chemotaxis protein
MMPEMDGFEVLRQIRDNSATSEIPVFILTAADLTESDNDFLKRATQGFFKKGDSWREELLAQVRKTVGRATFGEAASRALTK